MHEGQFGNLVKKLKELARGDGPLDRDAMVQTAFEIHRE
jgi:hypothetical protein